MPKQNPYIWAIILIVTACWGTWFYWNEIRPSNIRQMCSKEAQKAVEAVIRIDLQSRQNIDPKSTYQDVFNTCQERYGLKH